MTPLEQTFPYMRKENYCDKRELDHYLERKKIKNSAKNMRFYGIVFRMSDTVWNMKNKRYPENHEEDHEDRRELCMIPGQKVKIHMSLLIS